MTNNTIANVPRRLLERAVQIPSKASVEENHAAIIDRGRAQAEIRALLSTTSPANHVEDVRAMVAAPSPAGVDGLEVVGWYRMDDRKAITPYPSVCATWHKMGVKVGAAYSDSAQAIIDGLRGEVADLRTMLATVSKAGLRVRTERDQQAQRIGELEGLLRDFAYHTQRREMPTESSLAEWAALSAVCGAAPNIAPTSEHSSQPERTKVAELVELVRSKFPRIDPCQPVPLAEKAHCCEYTIYVERERLHRLIDAKLASLGVINLDYLPDDVVANAQNVRGYLTPLQLSLRYPEGHPNFTVKMWQSRSMNCTSSGYWDWLHLKLRYES